MSKSNSPPNLINVIRNWIAASAAAALFILILLFAGGVMGWWEAMGWRLGFETFAWASVSLSVLLFVILSAHFIYHHAKAYNRRAVAWATAFVVFSPLWAGIVYLLTWPKEDHS